MLRVTAHGFDTLGLKTVAWAAEVPNSVKAEGRKAAQEGLDVALSTVHVDHGDLKATGRIEEVDGGDDVEIDIVFGGEVGITRFVDYADMEEYLHPYLMPAVETVDFESALGRGLDPGAG